MKKYTTVAGLLQNMVALLEAHRPAFGQERVFMRVGGLLMGELFTFARHTVTQGLLSLGLTDADWTAWYRLFSRQRFDEAQVAGYLFRETLVHVAPDQPYTIGVDGVQVPRSSMKMPGTGWLRAPRTAPFMRGIHRAQRFVHGAWLVPIQAGYSRAISLRWLPAFPAKAVPAESPACREWEAGLQVVTWVRQQLDKAGRRNQLLLTLGDGAYDAVEFWKGLPARTVAAVRTARNRCLRQLPEAHAGRGRRRKYGAHAPAPAAWLAQRTGWHTCRVDVRGRHLKLTYRVEGPYLRERLPDRPLFLLVMRGNVWTVGKRHPRRKHRDPAFYLVSAIRQDDTWCLPLPMEQIIAWLWQRWELEVAHRELKTGLGLGEKQCWNRRSAVTSVQWTAWVYGLLVLAGLRTWGLFDGPPTPGRWWQGARRWSFNTLWRGYRTALWGTSEFQPIWSATGDNWQKKEGWMVGLRNAVAASARI
jgi:hypothetical protein